MVNENGTEYDYFSEIVRLLKSEGNTLIPDQIKIELIGKYGPDTDNSKLKELIDIAYRRFEFYHNEKCHIIDFANVMVHVIRNNYMKKGSKKQRDKYLQDFIESRDKLINHIRNNIVLKNKIIEIKFYDNEVTFEGYIEKEEFDKVYIFAKRYMLETYPNDCTECDFNNPSFKLMLKEINPDFVKHDDKDHSFLTERGDHICIIHDRDFSPELINGRCENKYPFTDEQYMDQVERVKNTGGIIDLYISTPMFEFWLLMHHTDIFNKLDIEDLNRHILEKNEVDWRYVKDKIEYLLNISEGRLDERFKYSYDENRYSYECAVERANQKWIINNKTEESKKHERFDKYYLPSIKSGEVFQHYVCENLSQLKDKCGTNIPSLIREMLHFTQ